jgi:hypothetical protein
MTWTSKQISHTTLGVADRCKHCGQCVAWGCAKSRLPVTQWFDLQQIQAFGSVRGQYQYSTDLRYMFAYCMLEVVLRTRQLSIVKAIPSHWHSSHARTPYRLSLFAEAKVKFDEAAWDSPCYMELIMFATLPRQVPHATDSSCVQTSLLHPYPS